MNRQINKQVNNQLMPTAKTCPSSPATEPGKGQAEMSMVFNNKFKASPEKLTTKCTAVISCPSDRDSDAN